MENTYSFNDLMYMPLMDILNKKIIRIDTQEILGNIYSRYPKNSKIDAIVNKGIIEFSVSNDFTVKKIYGITLDENEKLFKYVD